MVSPHWLGRAAALALAALSCEAKTVTHDFNVGWTTANPDGLAERKVVGINGQWPLPVIELDVGDRLVVNMHNQLDRPASIHWHGLFQNGTNYMDGPSMVTQCPVAAGASMTYNFTVEQPGTYWYHCHTDACYPDGYRQALIIHDKDAYFAKDYHKEITLTMTDWYHEMQDKLSAEFMSLYNPTGAEPIPGSFLLNDTLHSKISVEPDTTYLIRLINIGAFVGQYFYIEDHDFTIVEIDGVYTEPKKADLLYLTVAQRYAILLKTKKSTSKNYAIVTVADSTLLDTIPSDLQLNNTNWLEYNSKAAFPQANVKVDDSTQLSPFDDLKLTPHDKMPLLPKPDKEIEVTVYMENLNTGANYAMLDNITYTSPKVPTLYTVLSAGAEIAGNAEIYGEFTHPYVLEKNEVVQIVVNNGDTGNHPFHLHGHNFQVLERTPSYGPDFFKYSDGSETVFYDAGAHHNYPKYPARRDTFALPPGGHFVIRFVADNPGVWIFHCHIDWHLTSGLAMLMIEQPQQMRDTFTVPDDHWDACKSADVLSKGNAAGNTDDFFDLDHQNKQPGWIPAGFTPRGIVALVFSVISAVLGMAAIGFYGMADVKKPNGAATVESQESQDNSEPVLVEERAESKAQ